MDWSQSLRLISFTRACKTIRCNCWGSYQSNALRPPWGAQASANCPVLKPNRWEGFTKPGAESSNSIVTQRVWIRNLRSESWSRRIRLTQSRFKFPTVWLEVDAELQPCEVQWTFNKLLRCIMTSKQPSHAYEKSSIGSQTHVEWVASTHHHWNFSWNSMFGP